MEREELKQGMETLPGGERTGSGTINGERETAELEGIEGHVSRVNWPVSNRKSEFPSSSIEVKCGAINVEERETNSVGRSTSSLATRDSPETTEDGGDAQQIAAGSIPGPANQEADGEKNTHRPHGEKARPPSNYHHTNDEEAKGQTSNTQNTGRNGPQHRRKRKRTNSGR